jgi:hypothetical protein
MGPRRPRCLSSTENGGVRSVVEIWLRFFKPWVRFASSLLGWFFQPEFVPQNAKDRELDDGSSFRNPAIGFVFSTPEFVP